MVITSKPKCWKLRSLLKINLYSSCSERECLGILGFIFRQDINAQMPLSKFCIKLIALHQDDDVLLYYEVIYYSTLYYD